MFFLYHSSTRPTGKWLAKALGFPGFGTCKTLKQRHEDFLFRWGNSDQEYRDAGNVIQTARAIRNAADKLAAFRLMAEAGVPVPRFTTSAAEAHGWGTAFLGRTRSGSKGRGITVYPAGVPQPYGHQLYTEFIPNDREYRLHVVGGNVVRVQRKYLEREELNGDGYIKNHDHGYVFKQPQKDLNASRKDAAVAACTALGLDFGAVDMVIDNSGKEFVLEVNTAPSCSPLTAKAYVEALAPVIQGRTGVAPRINLGVLEALAARD